jgi:general stress protein 26
MSESDYLPVIVSTTSADTEQSIYEFLKDSPVGVLSTVGEDNKPHGVVIYFSVDRNFVFTFVTKKGTTKHQNLHTQNDVMLVVFDAYSQTTVQVTAKAMEMTDQTAAEAAFNRTLEAARQTSDAGTPPITKIWAGDYVAYELKPSHIQMRVFVRPDPGGNDLFESIDFKG